MTDSPSIPSRNSVQYPYILFNKDPEQLRRLGTRGGKAFGRNQRLRRALLRTSLAVTPPPVVHQQTTAEAIAMLNLQFPWLRAADRRVPATNKGQGAPRAAAETERAPSKRRREAQAAGPMINQAPHAPAISSHDLSRGRR
jgi:hypothetical protein